MCYSGGVFTLSDRGVPMHDRTMEHDPLFQSPVQPALDANSVPCVQGEPADGEGCLDKFAGRIDQVSETLNRISACFQRDPAVRDWYPTGFIERTVSLFVLLWMIAVFALGCLMLWGMGYLFWSFFREVVFG
jgi:hypothetical protein